MHADCICQRDCAQPGRTRQQAFQAQDPGVAGEMKEWCRVEGIRFRVKGNGTRRTACVLRVFRLGIGDLGFRIEMN